MSYGVARRGDQASNRVLEVGRFPLLHIQPSMAPQLDAMYGKPTMGVPLWVNNAHDPWYGVVLSRHLGNGLPGYRNHVLNCMSAQQCCHLQGQGSALPPARRLPRALS